MLEFFLSVGKLKKVKRSGWIRYHIVDPESVAEHSFRTALLAMSLAPKVGVDQAKTTKMALIHDLAEAEIGDIVTHKGTEDLPNLPEKIKAERKAFVSMFSLLDEAGTIALFDEFEANTTPEAQFVKQLDVLEMAIQAYEYEKEYQVNLEEFLDYAKSKIKISELLSLLDEMLIDRI